MGDLVLFFFLAGGEGDARRLSARLLKFMLKYMFYRVLFTFENRRVYITTVSGSNW